MSDGQALFLILCLFYLSECFLWVKKQSVAFVSPWCRRWRVAALDSPLANSSGGLLFMNPLPPLGSVFLSHLPPISISPLGICAFNLQTLPLVGRPTQSGRSLTFSEVTGSTTDGKQLLINNEKFAKCATTRQAQRLSQLINIARSAAPGDREGLVRAFISEQFASEKAATALRQADLVIKPVRWMCSILFIFLFLMTPILVSIFGLLFALIPVGVVVMFLVVQIAVMFYRAHQKLFSSEREERIQNVIKMVLCPPVAIRSTDLLSKEVLADYSPTLIATMLSPALAQQFVRAYILDLQNPLKHEESDEMATEIITWAADEQLKFCLEYINRNGNISSEVLLAPPEQSEDSMSYCPRCRCQFIVESGACPDCPGVRLLAFSEQTEMIVEVV
jgi:hypothetical protein